MPVQRLNLFVFETVRITDIRMKVIASSARKAGYGPVGPGTVAAKFTDWSATKLPKSR